MILAAIRAPALIAAIRLPRGTRIGWFLFLLAVLISLRSLGGPCAAQQFSADLVGTNLGRTAASTSGKIHVSDSKVRIELRDFPGGLFLLDVGAHSAYFVKPAQRVVMDAKQSTWLTQILVPVDPGDPCKQWQAMAEIAGAADQGGQWRCYQLGFESAGGRNMNGRNAIRYRATSPEGAVNDCWIDPQLGFVVSVRRDDGATVDLENIQEGPAPAGLFEIPGNFHRFDPHQLIDRIKHSDVWVEPGQ
jgi:hypothetical protein